MRSTVQFKMFNALRPPPEPRKASGREDEGLVSPSGGFSTKPSEGQRHRLFGRLPLMRGEPGLEPR
jgi:hypothetical protein